MRFLFALILALPAAASASPLSDCTDRYINLRRAIEGSIYKLPVAQQYRLDPLRDSVIASLTFLRSSEGQTGYPPLCSADVLAQVAEAQIAVQKVAAETAASLPKAEAEAERAALLKAIQAYLPR